MLVPEGMLTKLIAFPMVFVAVGLIACCLGIAIIHLQAEDVQ
jgi:Na+/H+-translocating membrane pyrophosphatase